MGWVMYNKIKERAIKLIVTYHEHMDQEIRGGGSNTQCYC